jgi:hypothetical protein
MCRQSTSELQRYIHSNHDIQQHVSVRVVCDWVTDDYAVGYRCNNTHGMRNRSVQHATN